MPDTDTRLAPLPDPFVYEDGSPVTHPGAWPHRRRALLERLVEIEYGGLPPVPSRLELECLDTSQPRRFGAGTRDTRYRLVHGEAPACQFHLDLLRPATEAAAPVILTGDGCWRYVSDALRRAILDRGWALASFNRTEIAADLPETCRDHGLYRAHPEGGFGAIAAWAWGYHRALDALERVEGIDAARVVITGHSRGGKTVLLAGATDERIALTAPNASGCGGTGSFRYQGPGCESLQQITTRFPHWFGPDFPAYAGREIELGFDQHALIGAVAPRPFLNTSAWGDTWANPRGTWQNLRAAREIYRFLGVPERLGWFFRPGRHDHAHEDWIRLLEFAEWQLRDGDPGGAAEAFTANPFPDLPAAFAWQAPIGDRSS